MLIAGILFLVFGTIFQAIGFLARNSTKGYSTARGTITDLRHTTSREFGPVAYPEITYTLPTGQTIIAESSTTASEEDGDVVGAEVDVRYDPNDPEKIEIGVPTRVVANVFLGFGIGFDVIGVAFLILSAL